ncbi:MAG: hypothetical protein PW792_06860 [Acidobacteriaceae bacterium]|nr:hypothetical protein [Acidobacteriaceae bacterium]
MKFKVTSLAAASLFTVAVAHAQTTGVSHPESLDDNITTSVAPAPKPVKPSPMVTAAPEATPAPVLRTHTDAEMATTAPVTYTAGTTVPPMAREPRDPSNEITEADSGIVMSVPAGPNELPEGTVLRASLDNTISTMDAKVGSHFTAHLTSDVQRNGRVLIPNGALVRGRITEVRVGHGLGSNAMLRLQPDTVTMPDGIPYPLDAQVIDLAPSDKEVSPSESHVSREGEIVADRHVKAKVAAVSLTTGSGAVAGALLGGGVGALVGATIGAGAGLVVLAKQDHQQTLPEGTVLVLNLDHSLQLNGR